MITNGRKNDSQWSLTTFLVIILDARKSVTITLVARRSVILWSKAVTKSSQTVARCSVNGALLDESKSSRTVVASGRKLSQVVVWTGLCSMSPKAVAQWSQAVAICSVTVVLLNECNHNKLFGTREEGTHLKAPCHKVLWNHAKHSGIDEKMQAPCEG